MSAKRPREPSAAQRDAPASKRSKGPSGPSDPVVKVTALVDDEAAKKRMFSALGNPSMIIQTHTPMDLNIPAPSTVVEWAIDAENGRLNCMTMNDSQTYIVIASLKVDIFLNKDRCADDVPISTLRLSSTQLKTMIAHNIKSSSALIMGVFKDCVRLSLYDTVNTNTGAMFELNQIVEKVGESSDESMVPDNMNFQYVIPQDTKQLRAHLTGMKSMSMVHVRICVYEVVNKDDGSRTIYSTMGSVPGSESVMSKWYRHNIKVVKDKTDPAVREYVDIHNCTIENVITECSESGTDITEKCFGIVPDWSSMRLLYNKAFSVSHLLEFLKDLPTKDVYMYLVANGSDESPDSVPLMLHANNSSGSWVRLIIGNSNLGDEEESSE